MKKTFSATRINGKQTIFRKFLKEKQYMMKLKECEIAKSTLLAKSMICNKRKYTFDYNGFLF